MDGGIVACGSSISGRNVSLDAARDITLESRQDNTHQDSKSSGSNAGTEPRNALDLFNSSGLGGDRVRCAIDAGGKMNRLFRQRKWNISSAGIDWRFIVDAKWLKN
ncbi:hemagglutinin repeat-containing protein [Ralstonia pseudosolanacearum]|uniref:hemagglutinin repeat-containing protein n=1 Tax=Ralstonia pseudosolanacearum TaxID=1310165 RepID=UPI001FF992DA|nr:hemagglutinin repeat-containing protein [Ralstonia pseudosolanacearum]